MRTIESSLLDGAALSFQLYGCNQVTWHLHFLELCGQGLLIRSLHNTNDFSFRQIGKASVRLHCRVVLGSLRDLVYLLAREGAGRNGMGAHEFRHRICSFSGFVMSGPCG
jgi:hypothetical protein